VHARIHSHSCAPGPYTWGTFRYPGGRTDRKRAAQGSRTSSQSPVETHKRKRCRYGRDGTQYLSGSFSRDSVGSGSSSLIGVLFFSDSVVCASTGCISDLLAGVTRFCKGHGVKGRVFCDCYTFQ